MPLDLNGLDLEQLLSNPELMRQVKAIAKSLSNENGGNNNTVPLQNAMDTATAAETADDVISAVASAEKAEPSTSADLLRKLEDTSEIPVSARPEQLPVFGFQKSDIALLKAICPYLRQDKQDRLNQVLRIMKMAELAQGMKNFL